MSQSLLPQGISSFLVLLQTGLARFESLNPFFLRVALRSISSSRWVYQLSRVLATVSIPSSSGQLFRRFYSTLFHELTHATSQSLLPQGSSSFSIRTISSFRTSQGWRLNPFFLRAALRSSMGYQPD